MDLILAIRFLRMIQNYKSNIEEKILNFNTVF